MKIGYARISTDEQKLDLQIDALKKYGCDQIFTDSMSGIKSQRPGLDEAFKFLREGDTLVVWKLDRLGRSVANLIELMGEIEKKKAGFHSIQECIDTSTAMGKLLFHFIGALADFERGLIMERSRAGIAAAKARGVNCGRSHKLQNADVKRLKEVYDSRKLSIKEIMKMFNLSKSSVYNYLHTKCALPLNTERLYVSERKVTD